MEFVALAIGSAVRRGEEDGKKANAAFLWLGFAVSVALLAWKTNSFIH